MKSIFISTILILLYSQLTAQPGTLDKSFGEGGTVISTYSGEIYSSVLQPDGKIVVGGRGDYYKDGKLTSSSLLARYNENGSIDFSFVVQQQN